MPGTRNFGNKLVNFLHQLGVSRLETSRWHQFITDVFAVGGETVGYYRSLDLLVIQRSGERIESVRQLVVYRRRKCLREASCRVGAEHGGVGMFMAE